MKPAPFDYARASSLEELKELRNMFPERKFVLGVYHENKLVGGYTVFTTSEEVLHIFYAALDYEYQIYRPLNVGLARLMQIGIERDLKFLNYGISTENGGKDINWGLFRFKEDFGGSGALRTYWVKDVNPRS